MYGQGGYMQPSSGIAVTADINPLQFMLYLVSPEVQIAGQKHKVSWGRAFVFPVQPGNWQIRVHYPWVFGDACIAQAVVPVHMGYVTDVVYKTALFVFSPGTLMQRAFRPWGT